MRLHLDSRTGIFGDAPELPCLWDDDGKDCPLEPAEGEWFCHPHLEAGEAAPDEYLRQLAAAERTLDEVGYLTLHGPATRARRAKPVALSGAGGTLGVGGTR